MVTDSSPTKVTVASYWDVASGEAPHLLSWQDREPFSETYGCFDRRYWAWKFSDFPGPRFQEGVYSLAHLYTGSRPGNAHAGQTCVLDWIRAGVRFWQGLQRTDGSFDEAYPFERSLAATAFTSFYVGEAILRIKEAFTADELAGLRTTFARAGDWLCHNNERHGVLSNHLAAAAAGEYVIYLLTGEERFERRCWEFVQRIYDYQSREGWYEEYGGADPGYQTHCTFYLGRLWQYTKDPTLLTSLERSMAFLKYFVHPNGTLGGEYGSRNTEFYFPAGFEILGVALKDAAQIARFMRASVGGQWAAGVRTMDEYNFLPMLNNYFCASENAIPLDEGEADLPCLHIGEWYFPDAGLFVKTTPAYYAVLGLSKGGVLRIYDRSLRRLRVNECGYWAKLSSGGVGSSQSLNRRGVWQLGDRGFRVETPFVEINQRLLSLWTFVAFRLFSLTLGRIPAVAYWLKRRLVQVLVSRRRQLPLRLRREVSFEAVTVRVADEIYVTGSVRVDLLRRGGKFATIHMGSSRYFQTEEMDALCDEGVDWAVELMQKRSVQIFWGVTMQETKA